MSLRSHETTGWRLNRINCGAPFHVDTSLKLGPQVCDERGVVALSGPNGAVFCASQEQADELCRMANAGELETV